MIKIWAVDIYIYIHTHTHTEEAFVEGLLRGNFRWFYFKFCVKFLRA